MYIGSLRGMGLDPATITAGIALYNAATKGGSSGGGSAAGQPSSNVAVSTQVSPQISPSFVQQMNPSNSPVNTSATQNVPALYNPLPNTPATGFIPGFDAGNYLPANYGAGYVYPTTQTSSTGLSTRTWLMIAGAVILAAVLYKKRAQVKTFALRSYARAKRAIA